MNHHIYSRRRIAAVLAVGIFILLLPCAMPAAAQDVVVIVNKGLRVNTVSKEDIAAVFTGKKTTWASGEVVAFVIYDDEDTQKNFFSTYIQKNPSQFKNYWKKRVFTGKGRMPKYVKSKDEVLEFVKTNPGGISFLPASDESVVKILNVN